MVPPRAPSFSVAALPAALGLPAGKAGLRPRSAMRSKNADPGWFGV